MLDSGGVTQTAVLDHQESGPTEKKRLVEAEAMARLRRSGYRDLRLVSCEFHEGVLTLRGRVSTFYLKQVAQTLICQLEGVEKVNNRLEVTAPPHSP